MTQELKKQISDVVQNLFGEEVEVNIERTAEQFGDYATNVAMQLAGKLNKNPREIAEQLAPEIQKIDSIQKIEVAGPGFINLTLTDKTLWRLAVSEPSKSLDGQTVVAEYSDPNPFKILHAGHLYTTITGDVIANLLENAGAKVHRLNYGGDVGRHVAITMWAIIKELGGEHPNKLDAIEPSKRLAWISESYVKGNSAFSEDERAKSEIQDLNKKIYQIHEQNDHDSSLAQIYWTCRQWSYEGFDNLYKQLQVQPFEKYIGESQTTPIGLEIVSQGLSQGVFEKSDEAIVYRGEDKGLHTRVFVTSQGLPTYEAKDLGLAALKWRDYKFDMGFIITGNDIIQYMQVVLAALSHFYPEIVSRSHHLTHGMIKMPGGKKMSSRLGNILTAQNILESARSEHKKTFGKNDDTVELAAVKYSLLKQRMGGDIVYDPAESVSIEGNSGPYLQYAYARARSILAKSHEKPTALKPDLDTAERSLLRKVGEYTEVVDKATAELMPHHICTYLYELAQTFNSFYEKSRIIDDPREKTRLKLVELYSKTLKNGLNLLGIEAPERM